MTAYRVVDDHNELKNIGSHTHDQIDSHIEETPFLLVSGSATAVSSSRILEAGTGISITDDGPGGNLTISATAIDFVFTNDLSVSLANGRSFGRYASGETIPAIGKTPAEIIMMAIAEPIDPTATLTSSNVLTSAFNTQGFVRTSLSCSYAINSAGASVQSASLQYRTGGSGSWTTLSTSTSNPLLFDHDFSVGPFYTTTINYQYNVLDTQGASKTISSNIVPQGYAAPTMSLAVTKVENGNILSESNTKREKGNVKSSLTGTITRQRQNVSLLSYSVQFSTDNVTWNDVPSLSSVAVVGNPSSVSIPSTVHEDASLKSFNRIYYRISVTDEYQTTNSSVTTLSFLDVIFFGASENITASSSDIRSLSGKIFTDVANPVELNTGATYRNFTIAMPESISLTQVLDLDALNANITNNYIRTTSLIDNGGGIGSSYSVYTMTNAIPYTDNHRHSFTRA